ncbi:uncharacterized protein LOC6532201 [Drosophila yakuba]|uniref:Drosophila melanogaster n=1 Tax=Drosophila yakuba TaxID=7245 RepID=B4PC32_DROYA|nr:uncharacterized protein LOC6532201 [Drosophila yakuba]EDW92687.1 uncharacterized protein Dyak_GE21066 [Drosophila yakuba]
MVYVCTLVALIFPALLLAAPWDSPNPKSQVEYISNDKTVASGYAKPNIVPITQAPVVTQTAPPPPPNSKNFAYNPMTQSWTLIAPGDPLPNNDTLVWNQSNDKWLTR